MSGAAAAVPALLRGRPVPALPEPAGFPPPRLQAVGKRLLPPRVSGRGGSGDRACFMRSGSPGPAAGGRLGRAGWAGPGLSVRRAFNPTVLPGIDIAKRRGARYRLGPELEIW